MQIKSCLQCGHFSCLDIKQERYIVPDVELDPEQISMILISEAAPANNGDYYYDGCEALFLKTTLLAFNDAGVEVQSLGDLLKRGIYLTSAVKCGKTGYNLSSKTIESCSYHLEKELALFPNVKVYLLMGDVAIKAFNYIAKRAGEKRVIPAGSTCKIRGNEFYYKDKRVFPSYLQAGPSFFIEKSKRTMIAEDIAKAVQLI